MNDDKVKQQVVEKILSSASILITVSKDPSVDALSAALGLATIVNRIGKHSAAIFSGAIPPAITFLEPQKTFESTPDSLRDFIIALSKEKADHLRYKVEGDVVKIFITPYRTTITSDDLEFTQGDYNVDLVLALGVASQDNLDASISAHGSILHDATVITLSAGKEVSNLGSIDWHEEGASSLSEMVATLADSLKANGTEVLLDEQVATALMTGIVAATDRFSNLQTSSKVMGIAAELMAAGANQQLIASKLEESHVVGAGAQAGATKFTPIAKQGESVMSENQEVDIAGIKSTLPPEQPAPNTQGPVTSEVPVEAPSQPAQANVETQPPAQSTLPSQQQQVETTPVVPGPVAASPASTIAPAYALSPEQPPALAPASLETTVQPTASTIQTNLSTLPPEPAADQTVLKHTYLSPNQPEPAADETLLPPPPPPPSFSTLPPMPPTAPVVPPPPAQPEKLGDILQPEPVTMPPTEDPGQFKIPGQQ